MRSNQPTPFVRSGPKLAACVLGLVVAAGCSESGKTTLEPDISLSNRGGPAVLDQEQPNIDAAANTAVIGGGPLSQQLLAQVFTAGITGRLREIHLPVGCSAGDLFVEIRTVDAAGVPTNTVLRRGRRVRARRLLGTNVPPVFSSLSLGGGVNVVAGQQYAFVLSSAGTCAAQPGPNNETSGDQYTGGVLFFDARPNPPGVWVPWFGPERDLAFQTYVRP